MANVIRDATIGQLIRYLTGDKVLLYPEEKPDFQCPACYADPDLTMKSSPNPPIASSLTSGDQTLYPDEVKQAPTEPTEAAGPTPTPVEHHSSTGLNRDSLERIDTSHSSLENNLEKAQTRDSKLSRVSTRTALAQAHTQADLQAAFSASAAASFGPQASQPIVPQRTSDGTILVDWYTVDDPENPQNWSFSKKIFVSLQIYMYTLAVYMGSAIYTASIGGVMEEFDVSIEAASLGLSLYVLAYGTGPLLWSPLSEIPAIGRNPPYIVTMGIFVILLIPSALVRNFGGLLVLRFLQGWFGSPCLATGGASLQDMYSLIKLPYVLCLWAMSAVCGPALGPMISGFSVAAENWRWSMWEMLWLSGPVFISMLLFLPETSSSNILLRRAQRLRKLTGDSRLKAQSEIDQANMRPKDIAFEALVRPWQLIFLDPAIGFTAGYVALCYGIYYSFFEAFPLVYVDLYGFNLGELGLAFLSIVVGAALATATYYTYIFKVVEPEIRLHGLGAPERRLIPAILASMVMPVGLFLFGWTGNGHIHWIVSVIGIGIFTMGVFVLMQCIFVYLPLVYPQYAASLFAGNDAARSLVAFAAVMFSRDMYIGMGIGPGTSLLGALTTACIGGIFVLYFYGHKLRAKSRFSSK